MDGACSGNSSSDDAVGYRRQPLSDDHRRDLCRRRRLGAAYDHVAHRGERTGCDWDVRDGRCRFVAPDLLLRCRVASLATHPMSGSTDYAIETSGLTRRFGSFVAVDGVTLRIPKGELYGFL